MTLSTVVEHLSMVVFAIVIAILIGVPLGLLCYLSRAARGGTAQGQFRCDPVGTARSNQMTCFTVKAERFIFIWGVVMFL